MGTLTPLALGLLALAAPIIALYMLKMRRREQIVSSTFLWEQALRDVQANAPWQRLRPNLLLFLQLLALAALVVALARPFWLGATPLGANLVVILDVSGSMGATDVGPSRLERAKDEVRGLIDDLPAGGQMTLLAAGAGAEVLQPATDNRAALRDALDRARGRSGLTDFREALALAAPTAERLPDTTVVIVGDGGFPDPGATDLRVPVRFIRVGERGENLGITAAATRRGAGGAAELFVRVQNFGRVERRTILSIYDGTGAGQTLVEARALTVPAGREAGATVGPLAPSLTLLRAEIDAVDDLALDNRAWVQPGAGKVRVLLTGAGPNTFLDRGLALQPNLVVERAQAGAGGADAARDYDLYVFDGVAPPRDVRGPVLLIGPPEDNGVVTVTGSVERPAVTAQDRDHPAMRGADLGRVQIASAAAIERPDWGRVLVESNGAPLLIAGEPGGRRTAVLAFGLQRSDLPLTLHFPILLANLTGWLAPEAGAGLPDATRPGEVATLTPRGGADSVIVTAPDGRERRLAPSRGVVLFNATDEPGPYLVRELAGERELRRGVFTVNLLSAAESDIAPRQPDLRTAAAGDTA
ncbi:MAG: VWA domain-containing protein, partial [Chloroflexota bacterium]|nr:VWA domain-containing protein [Chloroflexota bacterium]